MKVLVLTASAKEGSRSTRLMERFLTSLTKQCPDLSLVRRDLNANPPPHFSTELHTAFTTKPEVYEEQSALWTDRARELDRISLDLIKELKSVDLILLATPMYNWAIPSTLKCWLDNVIRQHYTFTIENNQVVGLLGRPDDQSSPPYNPHKKIVAFVTTDASPPEHITKYLKATFGFIGITNFSSVDVQFFDQDSNLEKAYAMVDKEFEKFAESLPPVPQP